ncbi:hypothetical protein KIN20_031705 [Parelaphostrongylus tenuis]|uniref:Uncharacterized protein n=1 Tax=Parelaphostrongylus tenuis TaxID=148309 RepID=A0AAD5R5G0_PARTN|nr:hypothetical protein KIN20_031705 [Parelaphostrongylus tenuis]
MSDKSCYMGAGGYSGYMGSGTAGGSYAREEYAGNTSGGSGATTTPPPKPQSNYASNVSGSDNQASCYFTPK